MKHLVKSKLKKFNANEFIKGFNEHLSKASSIEPVTPVTPSFLTCYTNDDDLQTLENKAYKDFVTPVTLVTPKNDNIQDYIIEQLEERVAIIEYDGQIPNDWALPIAKIQLRAKPESISKEKWQIIISNLETLPLYLNDIILHQWTISDIFGCHPIAPEKRFDVMGLLMLLNEGDRIIEVSRDVIRIQGGRGSIAGYYRPYYRYLYNQKACLDEI
jgi:hypothetical protein